MPLQKAYTTLGLPYDFTIHLAPTTKAASLVLVGHNGLRVFAFRCGSLLAVFRRLCAVAVLAKQLQIIEIIGPAVFKAQYMVDVPFGTRSDFDLAAFAMPPTGSKELCSLPWG